MELRLSWKEAVDSVSGLEADVGGLRQRFYAEDDPAYRDREIKPAWDRALEGNVAGSALVDLSDDATRQVGIVDTELPAAALLADATATPTTPVIGAFNQIFNGTTWDFMREGAIAGSIITDIGARSSNNDTVFTSASRAAGTTNSADFDVSTFKEAVVFLDITVAGNTTLDIEIQRRDPISGVYTTWDDSGGAKTFSQKTTTGSHSLFLSDPLGSTIRAQAVIVGTNWTFSMSLIEKT